MANNYDRENRINITNIIVKKVLYELKDTNDKVLLDYGCGTGLIGLPLSKYYEKVYLTDSSDTILKVVSDKIKQLSLKHTYTISIDKVDTIKYDYILLYQVLLHIPNTS